MRRDATFLGSVRRVVGVKVTIEISPSLLSASPIINGRAHRVGQVGSFVRIPLGFCNLYGVVSTVGASEAKDKDVHEPVEIGQRLLEIELVGEVIGSEGFQRGVSIFPTLDDEAHVVTEDDLANIYGAEGPSMIEIGKHAASESLTALVDLDKLVTRHSAIIGSTGSGKSNAVAGLLRALTKTVTIDGKDKLKYPSACVLVIDPHGEYEAALADRAKVFSINSQKNPLIVPYWAMPFDQLAWFLIDRKQATEDIRDLTLRDRIFEMRKANAAALKAGVIGQEEVTPDSPIPFDLCALWYEMDRRERATYEDDQRQTEALVKEGDAQRLIPAQFRPHTSTNTAPYKAQVEVSMQAHSNKIFRRLKDKRFDFLLKTDPYDGTTRDLHDLVAEWTNHEHSITVLDLGGVPPEIVDLVVSALVRIIFESMFWGRSLPGFGRQRPIFMVFEEAHTYLPKQATGRFISGYAGRAVERVLKEGRKYGIGACVVSQRPSELDETILSQCGTFFALRLSNPDDQGRVKSIVPDALSGLLDLLPALRTGEALVLGEAVRIPSRVRLPLIEPRPASDDPEVSKRWFEKRASPDYGVAITSWREQRVRSGVEKSEKE